MSLETTGLLYKGPNQTGQSTLIGLAQTDRHNHANSEALQRIGFDGAIQSGKLFDSPRVDVSITLFWQDQFKNNFLQMTAPRGSDSVTFWVTGAVHSWLLTSSAPGADHERRFSYRSIFAQRWKNLIDEKIRGSARQDVEPVLDWEMFPTNPPNSSLDPKLCYLKVHQDLIAFTPWPFPDYHVWLEYWIYLYPSGRGVRATVPQYGWYVEGGTIHDQVRDKFVPVVRDGAGALQSNLDQALAAFDNLFPASGVRDIYYMPGTQLTAPHGDVRGSTTDDTTIVIVTN
jgi:hypothetical protein